MSTRKLLVPILFLALFLAMQLPAWAAAVPTVTQPISLNPGWNAVYLEVQPLSSSPAVVFKGLPVGSSVWAWTGKDESVQFIQDPSEPPVNAPKWLAIFTSAAESGLDNMYAITANSAYLIHVPTGNAPLTVNVEGRPTIRHKGWVPDSFNLVGFGFASTPPTFATFFAPSNSHKDQAIYRLNNTTAAWEIINPATTAMRSGEAFWIYCQSGSDYQGPLAVEGDGSDGLDFGVGITILSLTLNNASTIDRTVRVSQLGSSNPVTLSYRIYDATKGKIPTSPLSGMPPLTVKAGSSSMITLAVMRGSFTGSAASVLDLTDEQGTRIRVPVSAISNPINNYPGLWSGSATIDKVSQLTDLVKVDKSTFDLPSNYEAKQTPAALNLNLILHQDRSGQARLLKQAVIMFQDGTRNPDGTPRIPGHYVVLTKDSLIPNYSGVTQRDGSKVGRRLSAIGIDYSPSTDATFGTDDDNTTLKCSGSISATVTCTLLLESSATYTHPTNPFLHKFHPDHDNRGEGVNYANFKQEVNRITRVMTLVFDATPATDPANPTTPPPGWGVTVLGGTYTERITGLAKGPIMLQGNFTIHMVADVEQLNQ